MKYKALIYICILYFNNSYSQNLDSFLKNRKANLIFNTKKLNTRTPNNYVPIKNKNRNIKEIKSNRRFKLLNQTYKGINIFSATKKINFDSHGNIIFYTDNYIDYHIIENYSFPKIENIISEYNIKECNVISHTKVYFPISKESVTPALKIIIKKKNILYLKILSSKYGIIYEKKLTKEAHINIEKATAEVFYPDPITSAHTTYGGDFTHNKGASNSSIKAQQKDVYIHCKYENGIYYLENDFVKITDISIPNWEVATSNDGRFIFNRSEIGFQQVNAFYHISEFKKLINSYGFNDAVDYQIKVDADGAEGDDNSFFSPEDDEENSTLEFGAYIVNGAEHVPDAEDSEVIIHEYTHAIINSYNHYVSTSAERECLEEAIADYFAVSYSRNINDYNWQNIFKWDGHNEFWDGRSAVSNKCYDEITFNSNDIYEHTDIWVAPLMDLYKQIGKETTDRLTLLTITGLSENTSMREAALIMRSFDSIYYDSKNIYAIYKAFNKYCILQNDNLSIDNLVISDDFEILDSYYFLSNGELSVILKKYFSGEIRLYDINGQVLISKNIIHEKTFSINSAFFPRGVYIIKIGDFEAVKIYKK